MRRLSLQLRITIICALILTGIAAVLTAVAVQNAKASYTNEFELNIGQDISLRYNDDEFSFSGEGEEFLGGLMGFIQNFIDDKEDEDDRVQGLFGRAGKEFTQKSIGAMAVIITIGIIVTYLLVRKALEPVSKLSRKVREINENNLYQKIEVPQTRDEIGSLACSFNDMLERLYRSFTSQKNFAANAAHELRTPLSTMKASIQVLEMDEEPRIEDYRETIEVIKNSSERMIRVVNDLMELSKSEQGSFTSIIDINSMLHDISAELSEKANNMKVSLRLGICEGTAAGNETLIYRALYNIVENAIKYNRAGGCVTVSSRILSTGVSITVSDSGMGISEEALQRIFEPFYRADRSGSRQIKGSGLGLAIVKEIVDKHKGSISVSSREDEGSVFEIYLPLRQNEQRAPAR